MSLKDARMPSLRDKIEAEKVEEKKEKPKRGRKPKKK